MMKLSENQVVKLRNGNHGVTAAFNGEVFQIIFAAYTSPITRYNEELKHKNSEYDIIAVFDGSDVTNVKDVFKKSFSSDNLKEIWRE